MTELIKNKLVQGKCYKLLSKYPNNNCGFWNAASIEYIKGNRQSTLIKCYFGDPIIFLEKVVINNCTYAHEFLKCLIHGKILYIDHWEGNLIFEQL